MTLGIKKIGSLEVDLFALRRALGLRPEVVEAASAKASGRASANPAIMWRHMTNSTYQSGDLPALAVREALQNGVDAIRAAIKARKRRADEGRFSVTWDPGERVLTYEDNGIGMDENTILEKFLVLGESGKGSAENSAEAAGGFGVAKAVILGVSETFRWEMHTRNSRAVASGADAEVPIYEAPFLQGTKITVRDIPAKFLTHYDYARGEDVPLLDRLEELLGANDLPGIKLTLNGKEVPLLFSRRAGSVVASGGSWGVGTSARIKAHRRGVGDRLGAYYIRLNGLFMFKAASFRGGLRTDVVIDLNTSVRPGAEGYPLTAARDQFQGTARYTFRDLAAEVERESESTGADLEDEIYDPESDDDDERQGGLAIAESTAEAFADTEFQDAIQQAAGGLADFYREQAQYPEKRMPASSNAPPGSKEEVTTTPPTWASGGALPDDAAGMIRSLLGQAETTPGEVLTPAVEQVLDRASTGVSLNETDVREIVNAVDRANDAALEPRGGGLIQVASVNRVFDALDQISDVKPDRPKNPFGKLAGLRISKTNYDKARARKFKKRFGEWLPYLTVWDATLRLLSAELRMRWRFKPGFVLNDEKYGLTSVNAAAGAVVHVHPDRLKQAAKAHEQRPMGLAGFLHGLAIHELTHLDGRMGDGHTEEFVTAREEMGFATGHLLPAIAVLAARVLKLPVPKAEQLKTRELERKLAERMKSPERSKSAAEIAQLRRELQAAKDELVAAQEASRQTAAAATKACEICSRSRADDYEAQAAKRVDRLFAKLRASPPPGITAAALEDFEQRKRPDMVRLVAKKLMARAAASSTPAVTPSSIAKTRFLAVLATSHPNLPPPQALELATELADLTVRADHGTDFPALFEHLDSELGYDASKKLAVVARELVSAPARRGRPKKPTPANAPGPVPLGSTGWSLVTVDTTRGGSGGGPQLVTATPRGEIILTVTVDGHLYFEARRLRADRAVELWVTGKELDAFSGESDILSRTPRQRLEATGQNIKITRVDERKVTHAQHDGATTFVREVLLTAVPALNTLLEATARHRKRTRLKNLRDTDPERSNLEDELQE